MDTPYREAVNQALAWIEEEPQAETYPVPADVLSDLINAIELEPDELVIGRDSGPSLWFLGSDGCAYNVDLGGTETPDDAREFALCRALLHHAIRELDRADRESPPAP